MCVCVYFIRLVIQSPPPNRACPPRSHKLLRNIDKFLHLIYSELGIPHYRVIRCNMEEIVLKGPHSDMDVRIVNSYPSKVFSPPPPLVARPTNLSLSLSLSPSELATLEALTAPQSDSIS